MGFLKSGFSELSLSLKYNFLQRKLLKQTNKQTVKNKKTKNAKHNKEKQKKKEKKKTYSEKHLPQRSHGISILSVSFHFDASSVILRNRLFRLRVDRIIMSHHTIGLMSLLHLLAILLFVTQ